MNNLPESNTPKKTFFQNYKKNLFDTFPYLFPYTLLFLIPTLFLIFYMVNIGTNVSLFAVLGILKVINHIVMTYLSFLFLTENRCPSFTELFKHTLNRLFPNLLFIITLILLCLPAVVIWQFLEYFLLKESLFYKNFLREHPNLDMLFAVGEIFAFLFMLCYGAFLFVKLYFSFFLINLPQRKILQVLKESYQLASNYSEKTIGFISGFLSGITGFYFCLAIIIAFLPLCQGNCGLYLLVVPYLAGFVFIAGLPLIIQAHAIYAMTALDYLSQAKLSNNSH